LAFTCETVDVSVVSEG